MEDSRPTGLITFLFTDVEGSTRLWEQHPESMKTALAEHDQILRSAAEDAGGYVFSTAGDAFSVAFADPRSVVDAAVHAQLGLRELGKTDPALRARMVIHTGSAQERDGDYFGPALNRSARLLSAAHGAQVLVSLATEELMKDSLVGDTKLRDLGEHRLKDLSKPERVFQLEHPGLPTDFPPLRSLDAFSHNLPIQLTSFVGREQEIEEVAKLIRGSRMVTLVGVGGAGKTRLALQTAAEVLPEFEDGCWLIELAPLTNPVRIPSTAAAALGVEERPDEDPLDTLAAWLRDKQLLLILDNCEHLIEAAARFAQRVLEAGTGVSLLGSSREMLGVPGEYPYQVRSLAAPDSVDEAIQSILLRYPAVRLFAERAEMARPGFRITTDNADAVVQIVNRLDGMPLAIELAAARLRMMQARQIADRLDDRFRLLTGGSRTALPRQQTLEAAIEWSYDLLSDEEKVLFARLAVFMGGFTLEAAEAVCSAEPLDEFVVLELLGHLVDKSLVQAEDRDQGVRYRMLETLRQYARARLADSEPVDGMRRRHAEYFRALAKEAEPHLRSAEEGYWFDRLDQELDNFRQAMGWAVEAGEGELAQATAGALYRYFMYRFRSVEGREWAESSLQASDEPSVARAKALLAAGTLAQTSLDYETSMKHLDQAIDLARSWDADDILSAALNNRANVAEGMGMSEQAERLQLETLDLHRRLGLKDGIVISLSNLMNMALNRQNYDMAIARAEEAVAVAQDLGSERLIHMSRASLIDALRAAGRREQAAEVLSQMIQREEERGYRFYPGQTAAIDAVLEMDRGEFGRAADLFLDAVQRFKTIPDYQIITWVVQWILHRGAHLLSSIGEPRLAAELLGASDAAVEAKSFVREPHEQGEVEATREAIRESVADFDTAYEAGRRIQSREALDLLINTLQEVVGQK